MGCINSAGGDLLTRELLNAALPLTEFMLEKPVQLVQVEQLQLYITGNT